MRRELYHLGFASHKEVMFRCPADAGAFLNRLAVRAQVHDTAVLADVEMSDHCHLLIESGDPGQFCAALRSSYTKYLNHRYGRSGRLGQVGCFCRKLEGPVQVVTAMSYILRNGMHHGVSPTPFAYPYSSVNEMFAKELGTELPRRGSLSQEEIVRILPRHTAVPSCFCFGDDGVILRQSFMDIPRAESFYVTPRNFLFQMNRVSDERWIAEQRKSDPDHPPADLAQMEPAFDADSITGFLSNERGWKYDPSRLTDWDVCAFLDRQASDRFGRQSVYQLSEKQKVFLFRKLRFDKHLPISQIRRCLVYPETE